MKLEVETKYARVRARILTSALSVLHSDFCLLH
jgi:hypothetical protein